MFHRVLFATLCAFVLLAPGEPPTAPDAKAPDAKAPDKPEPPVAPPEPPLEGTKEPPLEGSKEPPLEGPKEPPLEPGKGPLKPPEPLVEPGIDEPGGREPGKVSGWATMRGGKVKVPPKMVAVPEGSFQMGATDQSGDKETRDVLFTPSERPVRWLPKKIFCIDITETTNEDYKQFIDETRYTEPNHWEQGRYPTGKSLHPVVNVSFEDAKAYAAWKSKRDGIEYRLPFEDEWEKAARGTDGRLWPWGNIFDPLKCNTEEFWKAKGIAKPGEIRTMPVGSFPAGRSAFGVLDMAGSVWEWTQSWYDKYPDSTAIDKDFGKNFRVVRGGSWLYTKDRALCARRKKERKETIALDLGFRLVCDVIILKD
ncbi:MAG: formylglycine-generating enzyme family protein [Thermodesulfobacteriota bacterium]